MRTGSRHSALLAVLIAAVTTLALGGTAQAISYYPTTWLASLHYDGTDGDDPGEMMFPIQGSGTTYTAEPMRRLINEYSDYCDNNDGSYAYYIDVEDGSETYVPWKISSNASGSAFESIYYISSSHGSDQRPATYWRTRNLSTTICPVCDTYHAGWRVYEYWLYYAVNPTTFYAYPAHDHDWEKYYVYFYNENPTVVRFSFHHWFNSQSWVWLELNGFIEGTTHVKLSVEGEKDPITKGLKTGSHAFLTPGGQASPFQDGVRIKYDGYVTKRGGRLEYGDGTVQSFYIFSNDPEASGVTGYALSPTGSYFTGDTAITGTYERSGDMAPPWMRSDWDYPPGPDDPWGL